MNESQCRYAMVVAHAVAKEYDAPLPYSRSDLAQTALVDIIRTSQQRNDLYSNGWMSNRAHWSIRSEIKRLQKFGRTGKRAAVPFVPEWVSIDALEQFDLPTADDHELLEAEWLLDLMTPRQRQIARLVCLGYSNPEVASILGTTTSVVCNRLGSMRKMLLGRELGSEAIGRLGT